MLSAIVLAAGLSKRMGGANKLMLPYKNKTILQTTLENIIASGIEDIIVVTGHEPEKIQQSIQHLPVHIIHNPAHTKGMTTSIQHGVEHAKGSGYMICLADMFLITAPEYSLLSTAFENALAQDAACICLPQFLQQKGNPVIFSSFYKTGILQHTEMEGCKGIVQSNKEHIHLIDMPSGHILLDMDFAADYERYLAG